MFRSGSVLFGLCLTVIFTGCVMPDQLSEIQKDLSEVQRQIARVEREQHEALEKVASLENNLSQGGQVTRADFADMKLTAEENSRHLSVLREQLTETNRRLDRMSHDFQETRELGRRFAESGAGQGVPGTAATGTAEGAPESGRRTTMNPGVGAVPDPEALYNAAYADFSKGNYVLAISGFEEYTERFPSSDLADNALYWVSECYFSQGNFELAVESFDTLLERYPQSDRAAGANLKKGLAFLEQNQVGKAIVQLRYVMTTFPSSDEARIARDKLVSLGASVQ